MPDTYHWDPSAARICCNPCCSWDFVPLWNWCHTQKHTILVITHCRNWIPQSTVRSLFSFLPNDIIYLKIHFAIYPPREDLPLFWTWSLFEDGRVRFTCSIQVAVKCASELGQPATREELNRKSDISVCMEIFILYDYLTKIVHWKKEKKIVTLKLAIPFFFSFSNI